MTYSAALLQHFFEPQNAGELIDLHVPVVTVCRGDFLMGEQIQLQLAWQQGVVGHTAFKAYGSAVTIAASSWVSAWLQNKTLSELTNFCSTLIIQALDLEPHHNSTAVRLHSCVKEATLKLRSLL